MPRLVAVMLVLAAAAACTKVQAKAPVAPPALLTPAPPDRVIVPAPIPEQIEPATPPPPPPSAPATPARPQVPANRPERPSPPASVVDSPTSTAPPILQTTSNPALVEQRANELIRAARNDLDRLNPALLSPNARAQDTTAKGFIHQAEDALKVRNVVLARELADKAAALAGQLRR